MPIPRIFVAYPSKPPQLGQVIEAALENMRDGPTSVHIESWPQIDIAGRFIVEGILARIAEADLVVADITRLNFNVIFEIGYAIGKGKRTALVVNKSLQPAQKEITQLGIFDTLGHKAYENATDLVQFLSKIEDFAPLHTDTHEVDRTAPIFILDTHYKTDASLRIIAKIKKARLRFRAFDPKEQSRLSTLEAYRQVAESVAVVVNLLASTATDYEYNNFRGAFLAGLSFGLDKEVLILQEGDDPVPLDYRDFVSTYKHPSDIDPYINNLAPKVVDGLQAVAGFAKTRDLGLLEKLDLGAPAAENEMGSLAGYYVPTDEYNKSVSGTIRLAVGRKGSGKTALFFRVRDSIRRDKSNVVLDLKPDGYQLKRFKFMVLNHVAEAIQEHVSIAFWEYVLLLEIAHRLLETDAQRHTRDHTLFESYNKLAKLYASDYGGEEVDFSGRMLGLVQRFTDEFEDKYGAEKTGQYLSTNEVTGLIYKHDIAALRQCLNEYLQNKKEVWVLFDNIDKGWPTRGVEPTDILILRSLLEASRNIERSFARQRIVIRTQVFVRNDVFELLVDESPDRGKESKVSLDWTDVNLLRELLRRRIVYNAFEQGNSFQEIWPQIIVSHINGEESSEYLIELSLMRPRNLLNLMNYCKSSAVNLRHPKIQEEDVRNACNIYSADIGNEIGLEIRDVFPDAVDILYFFIGAAPWLTLGEVKKILAVTPIKEANWNRLIEILLWFSFIGIVQQDENGDIKEVYIYNVFYDMKKLRRLAASLADDNTNFCIHRAFWPFLEIKDL